jgi:hypothetical protein
LRSIMQPYSRVRKSVLTKSNRHSEMPCSPLATIGFAGATEFAYLRLAFSANARGNDVTAGAHRLSFLHRFTTRRLTFVYVVRASQLTIQQE